MLKYGAANQMTQPPALTELSEAKVTIKKILNSGVFLPDTKEGRTLESALKVLDKVLREQKYLSDASK